MGKTRTRRSLVRTSGSLAVLAAALGCGGSSSPTITGPATGVYRGQSAAGNSVLGLVFADGRYYFLYTPPATPSLVSLVSTGAGAASNGNFSSSSLLSVSMSFAAYNTNPADGISSGTLSGTYAPAASLNATITYSPAGSGGSTFNLTYDSTSTTAPSLAQIAKTYSGTFSFNNNNGGVVTNYSTWQPTTTFSVSSAGAISGTVTCWTVPVCTSAPCPPPPTCTVTGTLTPRADLDAFDAVVTFGSTGGGGTPMATSGPTYNGVGYYDVATGRLYLSGISPATNHAIGFK